MLENIIEKCDPLYEYSVFAICMWKEKLCVVPCDSAMSGDYAVYDKAVVISEEKICNFPNKINGQPVDAILIRREGSGFKIDFAEDSWDGFQPIGDL